MEKYYIALCIFIIFINVILCFIMHFMSKDLSDLHNFIKCFLDDMLSMDKELLLKLEKREESKKDE